MIRLKSLIAAILFISFSILACKHDAPATGIDQQMLEMARETSGYVWYKQNDGLLNKSSGTGHKYAYLRTRYNDVAANMLDENGKVKPGAKFPEGSLVVKELTDGTNAERYAILLKRSGHESADENGWVWGYINADGTVAEPASKRGEICKGCHSQDGNIDYMLMNKFFP